MEKMEEHMTFARGVDVSSHQGVIDWAQVAAQWEFGVARMTIGRTTLDDRGVANLTGMLRTPIIGGAYGVVGYAEPVTDGAELLVRQIRAAGADPAKILVMLDAENFGDGRHPTIDQVDRYARHLHALLGRWPVAYVPGWWLEQHGYTASGLALANCPWAASHYLPQPWTDAHLLANKPADLHGFEQLAWLQYTDKATVSGIVGAADLNCHYGTPTQLRERLIGGTMSATGPATWDDADWKAHDKHVYDAAVAMIRQVTVGNQTDGAFSNYFEPLMAAAKAAGGPVDEVTLAAKLAPLLAGQLEIVGITTDPAGMVTVTFGQRTVT